MNRGLLPEMLHCTDMTVLESQRARFKWRRQQEEEEEESGYFSELSGVFSGPSQVQGFESGLIVRGAAGGAEDSIIRPVKPDSGLENRWPDMGKTGVPPAFGCGPCGPGFEANFSISRTTSFPPLAAAAAELKAKESLVLNDKPSAATGRESLKKRKIIPEDDSKNKRIKGFVEEGDSKITEQNNNNSRETSADNSKENSDVKKPDYIHVRARRGQATDSHSLAERVRREKISERMKYLQDLVPGCNKITGKAGMLDEIINYVQSLQRQVEFLSMKLAAVNPKLDFNINVNNFFEFPANFPTGMSSEMATNPAYLQFNPVQQVVSCSGIEMAINPPDMGIRRTIGAPVSIPEPFLDSSCFMKLESQPLQQLQQQSSSTWDDELQNFYSLHFDQDRSTAPFSSQPFTGSIEASNLKMEM